MEEKDKLKKIINYRLETISQCVPTTEKGKLVFEKMLTEIKRFLKGVNWDIFELKQTARRLGDILFHNYAEEGREYPITVDRSLTMEEMVDAGEYEEGCIDYWKENYAVTGSGKEQIVTYLMLFQGLKSTDEVLQRVRNAKKRFTTREELLAFGAQYPDVQRVCLRVNTILEEYLKEGKTVPYLNGGPNHDDYNSQYRGLQETVDSGRWRGANFFLVTPE